MASKVLAALGLLTLTLAGGALLYALASSGIAVIGPGNEPALVHIGGYNATHSIYYVRSGCFNAHLLVYTNGSFVNATRACAGDLVVLDNIKAEELGRVTAG